MYEKKHFFEVGGILRRPKNPDIFCSRFEKRDNISANEAPGLTNEILVILSR